MDFEKLTVMINDYLKINNPFKTYEEFISNKDNFIKQLEDMLVSSINSQIVEGDDLLSLKNYLANNGKKVNKDFKKIKFDNDFGKENQERIEENEYYTKLAINHSVNQTIKDRIVTNSIDIKSNRPSAQFLMSMTDDYDELGKLIDIFKEKNDNEVNKTYGLTYQELKQKFFINQLNKVESLCEYLSKPRTDEEIKNVLTNNYNILKFSQEVDANKLNEILDIYHIDKEAEQIKEKLASFDKYKDISTNLGKLLIKENIHANPLSKYANFDDLAILSEMAFSITKTEEELIESAPEKLSELFTKTIKGTPSTTALNSIKKIIPVIGNNRAEILSEGKPKYISEAETIISYMSLLAKKNGTTLDELEFFNEKNKKIDLSKEKDTEKAKKIYELALKNELTIKDKNGKFIDTFKTSEELKGYPEQEAGVASFNIEEECTKFENEIKEKAKDKDFDLVAAKTLLDTRLNQRMQEGLTSIFNQLFMISLPDKKGEIDEEIDDIQKMVSEIKDTNLSKVDKFEYCSGLKSVRTFCQAYLDAHIDSKDKVMEKKCNVINKVYKSLQGIEGQMDRMIGVENNLKLSFELKGKQFTEDEVKAFDKAIENGKYKPEEKVPVFTTDPTIENSNIDISEKVSNKELEKEKDLKINDVNK